MSYAMENPGSSLLENDENRTYSIPTWMTCEIFMMLNGWKKRKNFIIIKR